MSYAAIVISFIGIVIISLGGHYSALSGVNWLGVLLAVGSAFFWAAYWILNLKDGRDETEKILMNLCFGFVYVLLYILVVNGRIEFPSMDALPGVVYIGFFEMSVTFVFWMKALSNSSNTARVSNLIYLSPFLALFFIRFLVEEAIHASTLLGLAVVVSGIVLQQFANKTTR